MKTPKLLFVLMLAFASICSFGQATGNTLTVLDISGSSVYWEYNFSDTGGFISSSGPGAPIGVPIKLRMTRMGGGYIPPFYAGDLHGNCDSFISGSMNGTNTEFNTVLNDCCPSTTEVRLSNGLRYAITIPCAAGSSTPTCVSYAVTEVCGLYCLTFYIPSWASALCKSRNYSTTVNFINGTSTTVIVNFNNGNTTFCFTKPISSISSSIFNCNCGISPERISLTPEAIKDVVVSPNPTTSNVNFKGTHLEHFKVSFFDTNGNPVIQNAPIDVPVSLERQKPGIYVYVITDDNGNKKEGKIIKE